MPQVFISYAHANPDCDLAGQLTAALEANGLSVFVDSKIRIGQDWSEQIDVELRKSEFFVVLLSAVSIESPMVRREVAIAYKLKKEKKLTILPVRIALEAELPYELAAYLNLIQYAQWRPGESFEAICSSILNTILESTSLLALAEPLAAAAPAGSALRASPRPQHTMFDAAEVDRLRAELLLYLGPVARVIVDRALKKATSWQQLYELLAAELPEKERKTFLAPRLRQRP